MCSGFSAIPNATEGGLSYKMLSGCDNRTGEWIYCAPVISFEVLGEILITAGSPPPSAPRTPHLPHSSSPPSAASLCQSILNLTLSFPPLSAPKRDALLASPCQVLFFIIIISIHSQTSFIPHISRLMFQLSADRLFAEVKSTQGGM